MSLPTQMRATEHYDGHPLGRSILEPTIRPRAEEEAFTALGHGAHRWLREAAASGTPRIRRKRPQLRHPPHPKARRALPDRQDPRLGAGRELLDPHAHPERLTTLEWIGRKENLVISGPSGTGKSHFTEGLAQAAVEKDLKVAWFTPRDPRSHPR